MAKGDTSGSSAGDITAAYKAAADYIEELLDQEELEADVETQLILEDDFTHLFLLGVKYGKEKAVKETIAEVEGNGCGCPCGSICDKQG